ncbi:hypothetical protein [Halomonas rhizosphaerae]|uniref:Uncharacterized protein n=1 Tax=Halomonas rhizosphaerae TaxID=3043296 RepID=A0ABT6UUY7_9GAMM|nr:hypothetical protein [Halomonas rhizosphaerae]MDI5889496.1 hypothetical protein [Halomonas rhizosphaerae]
MDNMIRIDDYISLRIILWSFPSKKVISRQDAYEHYSNTWEYVSIRSLKDHEIELINSLINEFGPLVPKYRTFQTYSAERPYTWGRPVTRLTPISGKARVKVADYPQLNKSALLHGLSDAEITNNEAHLWYTEHWFDIDLDTMTDREKHFLNKLIYEFGPILPSLSPDSDEVGAPILSV